MLWLSELGLCFLVFRRRKAGSKTKASLFVFLGGYIASRTDDTASFVSKKSTSPAVMFTSRLVLPSAMTWTKVACVANLPYLYKDTRARFLLLAVVMMLLLYCGWFFWCCYYIQLPIALSSLLITCNEKTKEERHKKQRKQRTSGTFFSPTANFLVGNHGLRRAKRRDDMPSMSSEEGEI